MKQFDQQPMRGGRADVKRRAIDESIDGELSQFRISGFTDEAASLLFHTKNEQDLIEAIDSLYRSSGLKKEDLEVALGYLIAKKGTVELTAKYNWDETQRIIHLNELGLLDDARLISGFNDKLKYILQSYHESMGIDIKKIIFGLVEQDALSNYEIEHIWIFLSRCVDWEVDHPSENLNFTECADAVQRQVIDALLAKADYTFALNFFYDNLTESDVIQCIEGMLSAGAGNELIGLCMYSSHFETPRYAHYFQERVVPIISLESYIDFLFESFEKDEGKILWLDEQKLLTWQASNSERDQSIIYSILMTGPDISEALTQHLAARLPEFAPLTQSPFFRKKAIKYLMKESWLEYFYPAEYPSGAAQTALRYPWLVSSSSAWRESTIGLKEEREITLKKLLEKVPEEHRSSFTERFYAQGVTDGQMKTWLGQQAFKVPDGWNPAIVGEMMFSRLQSGVSTSPHDASYFLTTFEVPEALQENDLHAVKQRKEYITEAQRWLKNYISTPAKTLTLAWQNREAALADGCADNPSAIFVWTKANAVRRLLEQLKVTDLSYDPNEPNALAFLIEAVRQTSPEEALRLFQEIQPSHRADTMFRPVRIDLGNGYSGEIFRKDDPRGTTIGADTGCCMSVAGASEDCIIAGYTDPRCGFFALYHEGTLVAQSFLYANPEERPGVLVCDNIEATAGRDTDNILDLYRSFFSAYIGSQQKLFSAVHVGEGYSDVMVNKLEAITNNNCVPTPLDIYTDAKKQRLLLRLNSLVRTDSLSDGSNIQWLDTSPVVQFTQFPIPFDWGKYNEDNEEGDALPLAA